MLKSSSDSNKNPRPVWLVKRNANKPVIDVEAFSPLPEWELAQPDLFSPARLAQGKDHGFASNNCFSIKQSLLIGFRRGWDLGCLGALHALARDGLFYLLEYFMQGAVFIILFILFFAIHHANGMYFCVKGSFNNLVNKRMFIQISNSLGRVICATEKQQSLHSGEVQNGEWLKFLTDEQLKRLPNYYNVSKYFFLSID